jgi:RND family efflux transporter MFP subunit
MIAPGEQPVAHRTLKNSKLFKLKLSQIPIIYKSVGTVRSRDEIELAPRITARIIEITKRSGDSVKADEILVQLDNSDLKAAENQIIENMKSLDAALQLAKKDYIRQRRLLQENVIPRKSFEQSEQVLKSAIAAKKAAQQSLQQAAANLSYATIRSPMNGIVSDRMDDPGDIASPGNIIMKIFDPTRLMLYVPLRESLVKSAKIGDVVKFNVEALKRTFKGVIKEIVPSVDPGSRTFLVKMDITGDIKGLMPGMFGIVALKLGMEKAYIVPESAITQIGQLEYLTVMKNGKPSRVLVRTVDGPEPGTLRIVSGIDSDTEIVL